MTASRRAICGWGSMGCALPSGEHLLPHHWGSPTSGETVSSCRPWVVRGRLPLPRKDAEPTLRNTDQPG